MGYSAGLISYLCSLVDHGVMVKPNAVLELGAQEQNRDILFDDRIQFLQTFGQNIDSDSISKMMLMPLGEFAAELYLTAGIAYNALDVYENKWATICDLNHEDCPDNYVNSFDLVTNFGTTEHVCNQANSFKVIHDALKIGGVAIHQLPCTGYFNHGLYTYSPKFFLILAHMNQYEILDFWLSSPGWTEDINDVQNVPGTEYYKDKIGSGILNVVFKKTSDSEFVIPSDVDLRAVERSYPEQYFQAMKCPAPQDVSIGDIERCPNIWIKPTASPKGKSDISPNPLVEIHNLMAGNGISSDTYAKAVSSLGTKADAKLLGAVQSGKCENIDELIHALWFENEEASRSEFTVELGHPFPGTGWGEAVIEQYAPYRNWRWLNPKGRSTVLVKLNPGQYTVHSTFFDAKPGDAINRLKISAIGARIYGGEIINDNGRLYHLCKFSVSDPNGNVVLEYSLKQKKSFFGAKELMNVSLSSLDVF